MFVKLKHSLIPFFASKRVQAIVIILFFWIYYKWSYSEESSANDKITLFEQLIYDHALSKVINDDLKVKYYIDSFTFDKNMLTVKQLEIHKSRKEWYADTVTLQSFIRIIHSLMATTLDPKSTYYKNENIWKIIRHTIGEVQAAVPLVPEDGKYPWGGNWYQFSITYPLFLVTAAHMQRRLFQKNDAFMTKHVSSYISNYFKDPPEVSGLMSLGSLRDGPNAIMMAVPYIGGHLLMNDWNESSTSMHYLRNYFQQKYVTTNDGFYPDGTFIFHTELRAFGYITQSYNDMILLLKFMGLTSNLKAIYLALAKTEHPAIPLHFGPWFTRTSLQRSEYSKYGQLGFFVFDHMRGVSAKTADWIISFNGQHRNICFYESDATNYGWAQYWTMARRFMYNDTSSQIYKQLLPYYPGIWSYGRQTIDIIPDVITTETFLPTFANCTICQLGDEAIGMFNKYTVDMDGSLFSVVELNLLTRKGIHCYYSIRPNVKKALKKRLTLGVQVDTLAKESPLAGEGAQYGKRFSKSGAFVYPGASGKVKTTKIQDPSATKKTLTALYIEPKLNNRVAECGFSHVHSESGHNELIAQPKINHIETSGLSLLYFEKHSILVLYNKITKVAIVSKDMGEVYRTDLSIDRYALDAIFEQGYMAQNSILIESSFKLNILDGAKYQAVISNATPKAVPEA